MYKICFAILWKMTCKKGIPNVFLPRRFSDGKYRFGMPKTAGFQTPRREVSGIFRAAIRRRFSSISGSCACKFEPIMCSDA